jgi:multidrug efflux pump subunit AcrB
MAKSTVGEYTFAIFAVTAAALLDLVAGVGLLRALPRHAAVEDQAACGGDQPHELFDTPFYARFRALVNWCVQHRWLTIAITIGTLVLGPRRHGQGAEPVLPRLEPARSAGRPVVSRRHVVCGQRRGHQAVEARGHEDRGVGNVTTWIGSGLPRFALVLDQIFQQSNVSQLVVLPKDKARATACAPSCRRSWRANSPRCAAAPSCCRTAAGAVPGAVPRRRPDPAKVRAYADEVKAIMRGNPNLRGINDNWNESVKVLRLEVDQDKARALGVSSQAIAQAARTINSGSTIGQYRDGDKLIDIVLRQPLDERNQVTDLASAYVPTTNGRSIPLGQIARANFVWEPGVLWREGPRLCGHRAGRHRRRPAGRDGDRRSSTRCSSRSARRCCRVTTSMSPERSKESSKGQGSIAVGAPLMLFIMFTLLMLQLHSFSRSVLVFLTGPMGIAAWPGALLILNRPFGFVALLGVIALMGMIMRNSVILIDQIEQDRAKGVPAWTAIVEAAVRRFRPIILTAAAAVLAMIPLSRSVFWGPMAVAIMGGLIVATVLTLLALPAMYAAWFRVKPADLPEPEEVPIGALPAQG